MCVCVYTLFFLFFSIVVYQRTLMYPLCHPVCPRCLFTLSVIVTSANPSPPLCSSPTVFPLATTSLFCISMSRFLFCKWVHLCRSLDSTYKQHQTVFVFLILTHFT